MQTVFHWERFWCPRDKRFHLSDGGFLYDPDSEYGIVLNPDLVKFNKLSDKACLALLGEPGIGKSWALINEKERLKSTIAAKGEKILWLDLRSFGSEDRLWSTLFEGEEFREWRNSDYVLHVFLDSLDECLLRIDNVAALIADQLPNEPVQRLRMRIACRTAPWPTFLETALIKVFGDDEFEAYELVPLRRKDVSHASEQRGITDPGRFIEKIESLDVVSLAIKPVTLDFLINTYRRDLDLPKNQLDLYEKGCRILCEETNESRIAAGRRGKLSSDQRLVIASRIAAITEFCNRYAVWSGSEASAVSTEDVLIADIAGGTEPGLVGIEVSRDAIGEVLDTGLFSSRGPDRIGWAHQTYAEFLAAWYCKNRAMQPTQIRDLIFHPGGNTKRLVPQLHELAGWLSIVSAGMLEMVARANPESLLGAAAANLSNEQKGHVVRFILAQAEAGRLLNLRLELYPLYRKLSHPSLPEQLRPFLLDRIRNLVSREVAVDIVRSCEVRQLSSELADVAIDQSEPMELRIPAAAAAAALGPPEVRSRLRPLATGQAGDDPNDELKGSGLAALWPDLMNSSELFTLLSLPKNRSLSGAYSSFLYHQLEPKLKAADLPAALEWFCGQGQRSGGPLDRVMDQVIQLAWKHLAEPGVAAPLAKALLSRIKLHDRLMSGLGTRDFEKEVGVDHERRRMLLLEILPYIDERELFFLRHAGVPIIAESDFPWILKYVTSLQELAALTGAKLLRYVTDSRNPAHMQQLWHACQTNTVINSECKILFDPVPLDSEQTRMLREDLRDRNAPKAQLLDPPPHERVARDLHEIENGNISKWVALTWDLSLEPASTQYDDTSPDVASMPGWNAANTDTKSRIINAAFRYACEGEPENEKWFRTREIYHSAIAGFRALALLFTVVPDKLQNLSLDCWRKWIPMLLTYPYAEGESKLRARLLETVHLQVADEVEKHLLLLVDDALKEQEYFFLTNEIELCWSEHLGETLLGRVGPHLRPSLVRNLLQILLKHEVPGSRDVAKLFILLPPPTAEDAKNAMTSAIQALVAETPDASWPEIWSILRDYPEFGKGLIESISYASFGNVSFIKKLTEDQLCDVYIWMLTTYPPAPFQGNRAGAVSSGQAAVMFRDQILEHLKKRSNFAACEAISRVRERFPAYTWLGFHLEEAESLARASTWQPIAPWQLLALASDHAKRLVESPQQLLDVVVESLDRFSVKLHQELPAARDLWNVDKARYWPKDENDFSDYVARHLNEDIQGRGIVVNREVQIRRGTGSGTGQFTDIHIDAIVPGSHPGSYVRVCGILEAKGNWHAELYTAMEKQLCDRYLKDTQCKAGIYLVGWFSCEKWHTSDPRKQKCPTVSIEVAREQLLQQGKALSQRGYDVRSYVVDCTLT